MSSCALKVVPNKKQKIFFVAQKKYIAYGGARGGGKSWAMRTKAVLLALNKPGLKILLLRRTFPELEANHIIPLQQLLKGIAVYQSAKKNFLFPNGSFIKLGYCKSEADALQYQGHEYDVICFEEATLFTDFQLTFISTCLRTIRSDFVPRIYYTCNPGGVGHAYIKRLFIDRDFNESEDPDDYVFVAASVFDNEILMKNDPSYIKVLDNLPEELRRAHRDGDWDALSGQYFREFRRSIHAIEPFDIPDSWDRYITLDYGLDMTAVYWIAVDHFKDCYVYREMYEPNLIISDAAKRIQMLTGNENIRATYVPPDLSARRQDTGKSALTIFIENGIIGITTKNDRVAGWLSLKEMLKPNAEGIPRLRFFNTCKHIIRNLPIIQRSDHDPNDISQEPHDLTHGPDALRYFVSTFISNPKVEKRVLSGTWSYGELLMKGYSKSFIDKMIKGGQIKVIGV